MFRVLIRVQKYIRVMPFIIWYAAGSNIDRELDNVTRLNNRIVILLVGSSIKYILVFLSFYWFQRCEGQNPFLDTGLKGFFTCTVRVDGE